MGFPCNSRLCLRSHIQLGANRCLGGSCAGSILQVLHCILPFPIRQMEIHQVTKNRKGERVSCMWLRKGLCKYFCPAFLFKMYPIILLCLFPQHLQHKRSKNIGINAFWSHKHITMYPPILCREWIWWSRCPCPLHFLSLCCLSADWLSGSRCLIPSLFHDL